MLLNHTIVSCRDQQRSAAFLASILGLPAPARFGHFLVVQADNNVSLDFAETTGKITPQYYAFLVGEEEFDAAFGRIRGQDLPYWADPGQAKAGLAAMRQKRTSLATRARGTSSISSARSMPDRRNRSARSGPLR